MTETLLQTKLHIPVTRRSLVPRTRLLVKLNAGLDGRLTLVAAPAGFGKTTLVVDWRRQLPEARQLTWFSLDENDNELSRFFVYVITALQKIDDRIGQAALDMLHSPQANNIQVVLTDLVNTLAQSTQAVILALDDYHLITNPAIHDGINFLLENAPAHFHLLLISRADPPFSLVRLRARHQITEIRQNDLRFSPTEASAFLNQLMALDLPETAVTALEKRTEGWVAGLQMAALALQGSLSLHGRSDVDAFIRGFTASHRYIFDYLAEEVLAQRPTGTRAFLLQTAVLDRFCASLCDAVLGIAETADSSSQQILDQLESANLFLIPLDDERRWYRYHHLFADLLQQQMRREKPGLENLIHQRASRWFEQADYPEEAVQHALSAADSERAASLVTRYSEDWLKLGEIGKIVLWTGRLPVERWQQNLQLTLNYAWALLLNGRAQDVKAILANLPTSFTETSLDMLVLRGTLAIELGQIAQADYLLEQAEAQLKKLEPNAANQASLGLAVNGLAYSCHIQCKDLRAEQNYQVGITLNRDSGNLFATIKATLGLGFLLVGQARLHEAQIVFLDGLQTEQQLARILGKPDQKLVSAAPLHIRLGQIYYQWNRLAEAEAQLVDAGKLIAISDLADRCLGLVALAELRLAQNQAETILPVLAQLQEMERMANPPYIRRQLAIALATVSCTLFSRGPTPELRAIIEQSYSTLTTVALDPVTQARALITLGRPHEAVPLLEKLATQTEMTGRYGDWLPAAILLSVTYRVIGEKALALSWLKRAVQSAESSGYIRLFLDEGEPMQRLLAELAQLEKAPNYTAALLAHFPPPPPSANDLLSPREQEVLQLVAGGLTNQQIADKLVIAPSTAKRHVMNIYNKLNINNRAEATARAYELGLVNLE